RRLGWTWAVAYSQGSRTSRSRVLLSRRSAAASLAEISRSSIHKVYARREHCVSRHPDLQTEATKLERTASLLRSAGVCSPAAASHIGALIGDKGCLITELKYYCPFITKARALRQRSATCMRSFPALPASASLSAKTEAETIRKKYCVISPHGCLFDSI